MDVVRIDPRYRGPAESGNGGYVAGTVAQLVDAGGIVELRSPPPLDVDLEVRPTGAEVEVVDGDTLVARARPSGAPTGRPPMVPTLEQATRAVDGYAGFTEHAFPQCFVCGPERAVGDGLRIFPGPVDGGEVVAAPWIPTADLAGADGAVAPAFVWAALDCPGYFGAANGRVAVLASMRARQDAPVAVGVPLVAIGWGQGVEGRKIRAASALATADGAVVAVSESLWIELRTTE